MVANLTKKTNFFAGLNGENQINSVQSASLLSSLSAERLPFLFAHLTPLSYFKIGQSSKECLGDVLLA